jgi:aldehyde:ferredoxin oxidoreductase
MQRAGIDRTGFVTAADLLVYMANRGIIPKEDIEGLEMNVPSLVKMIWKVAYRQGIGDAIADGLAGLKRRFGPEVEKHAVSCKGINMYADPRSGKLGTNQFVQIIDQGGTHGKGGMVNPGKFEAGAGVEKFINFGKYVAIPEDAMSKIIESSDAVNIARMSKYTEILFFIFSSLGLCIRAHISLNFYPFTRMAALFSAATGYEIDQNQLRVTGERIMNLVKLLNVREGFSRKDDKFPARWLEPLKAGDEELKLRDYFGNYLGAEDLQRLLDDFYDEMGWDVTMGIPALDKIKELGLEFTIPDLKNAGLI